MEAQPKMSSAMKWTIPNGNRSGSCTPLNDENAPEEIFDLNEEKFIATDSIVCSWEKFENPPESQTAELFSEIPSNSAATKEKENRTDFFDWSEFQIVDEIEEKNWKKEEKSKEKLRKNSPKRKENDFKSNFEEKKRKKKFS